MYIANKRRNRVDCVPPRANWGPDWLLTEAESRPVVAPMPIDEAVTPPATFSPTAVDGILPVAMPSDIADRFNGIMHARTADLIAHNRPCSDALMSEPASDEWIAANEQNWLDADDADVDWLMAKPNWPTSRCLYCDGYLVHSDDCKALRESWTPKLEFGKHKGKRLDETPTDYLRWLLKSDAIKDVDVRKAARAVLGIPEPVTEQDG